MLNSKELKNHVHRKDIRQKHAILLVIASDDEAEKSTGTIKSLLYGAGLRKAKNWNIAAIMKDASHLAFNVAGKWELTDDGRIEVASVFNLSTDDEVVSIAGTALEKTLSVLKNEDTISFVREALECVHGGQKRVAVVLTWVGAVHLLYDYVFANKLGEFNAEASNRFKNWKTARSPEDFTKITEFNFLQVAHAVSVFDKAVKDELEQRLKFRNACGHPSALSFTEHSVMHHIDILVTNVFKKFS